MDNKEGLTIVIPALNEPYLPKLYSDIETICDKLNIEYEVLVETIKGCGNAILKGISESRYKYVLVMDADGSHSPLYIINMWNMINRENYDLIYGRKGLSNDSLFRKIVTKIFGFIARIFVRDYPDLMSGFFIFDKTKINPLPDKIDHPKVLLYIVKHNKNIKIDYINIIFYKRKGGKSKLGKPSIALSIIKEIMLR